VAPSAVIDEDGFAKVDLSRPAGSSPLSIVAASTSKSAVALTMKFIPTWRRYLPIKSRRRGRSDAVWCTGPWRDWLVPLRWNVWIQTGLICTVVGFVLIIAAKDMLRILGLSSLARAYCLAAAVAMIAIGIPVLGAAEFGRGTVLAYRRSRRRIAARVQSSGNVDPFPPHLQHLYASSFYCVRAGARAAASEAGLEDKLIPGLRASLNFRSRMRSER